METATTPKVTRFDVRGKRIKAGLSQLGLCLRSDVLRWRLRLCEQGVLELRTDELERIVRVCKEAREARKVAGRAAHLALGRSRRHGVRCSGR
jgi:predicted transcriptional regulator